jgi:phosphoribosylaminoimidazolecarboxamide formyltransferase/IMP cyclohydrolase
MAFKRALISVSDKRNLLPLCEKLKSWHVEIVSTGGTAKLLAEAGIDVLPVNRVTGFPEMMDGRVKTLHPKIHGGLLALRENREHRKSAQEHGIDMIDLVVVNLYPFEETVAREGVTLDKALENIDIRGPSMLRSAAKNYRHVCVLSSPDDYGDFVDEYEKNEGEISEEMRQTLAQKVFALTGRYDAMISDYFRKKKCSEDIPEDFHFHFEKVQDLRYGENPHQESALYRPRGIAEKGLLGGRLLNGKALSYNNLIDAEAAWTLANEFSEEAACVIVKHCNPCGCAVDEVLPKAFEKAWASDPVSAFGSIIAFNGKVDQELAESVVAGKKFIEVILSPEFSPEARQILSSRKGWGGNLRLLEVKEKFTGKFCFRSFEGGLLLQEEDKELWETFEEKTRSVSEREKRDLEFSWKVVKQVKSNAIVLAKNGQLLGVGAGQMNRVQSVELALKQAGEKARGAVLASDAFFPFRDSIDLAARFSISAVIQPGGSKKDDEVIEACRENDMAMVFTGMRHFRHG